MKTLTAEQKLAIESPQNVCVIASAGTGKTTVLTQRFLHIHQSLGVPLSQILAFTFTEPAAREMKDRILAAEGIALFDLPFLKVSTIHAFCSKILKQHAAKLGLKSDFKLLDASASELLQAKEIETHLQKMLRDKNPILTQAYTILGYKTLSLCLSQLNKLNLLSLCKKQLICNSAQSEIKLFQSLIDYAVQWQEASLQKRILENTLNFDDLEILAVRLLESEPSILSNLQKQFSHILVDEFQDISPMQFRLIQLLHHTSQNKLFVVGDPKQSIYRFRKAGSQIFFAMQNHILNQDGLLVNLTQTFRTPTSQQTRFNSIFPLILNTSEEQNLYQPGQSQFIDPQAMLYRAIEESDHPENLTGIQQIAATIEHLIHKGVPAHEIVVLSNTRLALSRIKDELTHKSIETIFENRRDILDAPAISLLVAILNLLLEPTQKIHLGNILRHSHFKLTLAEQYHFLNECEANNITTESLPQNEIIRQFWQNFRHWQIIKDTITHKLLCEKIISDLQIQLDQQTIYYLENFYKILESWQMQGLQTLRDIQDLLTTMQSEGAELADLAVQKSGIRLLTIHASKGLEYKHVLIYGAPKGSGEKEIYLFDPQNGFSFKTPKNLKQLSLNEDLESFEHYDSLKLEIQTDNQNELKRLIYVALTRTQKNLYLFYPSPSKTLLKAIAKDADDTKHLKSFQDILYWIGQRAEAKPLEDFFTTFKAINLEETKSESAIAEDHTHTPLTHAKPIWTVSELEQFSECPRYYEYRYLKGWILKDTSFLNTPIFSESFEKLSGVQKGNYVHEVLQFYSPQRQNLKNVVEQALFNQHLKLDSDSTYQKTLSIIDGFRNNETLWSWLFDYNEAKHEFEFLLELDSLTLKGQIDKLVLRDGQWMILDYKTHAITSQAQKEILSQKFKFQMLCYALAVRQKFNQDSVRAVLVFTEIQDVTVFEFSNTDLNNFHQALETLHRNFKQQPLQNYSHTSNRSNCKACVYHKTQTCDVVLSDVSSSLGQI